MIAMKLGLGLGGAPANIETTLGRLLSFHSTASLLEILDSLFILLIGLYENRAAVAELHDDASTLINHVFTL